MNPKNIATCIGLLACLLVAVAVATEVSESQVDESQWATVTHLPINARRSSRAPVGLWAHGGTAAADAAFFDEEDAALAVWHKAHVEAIKLRKRLDAEREAKRSGGRKQRRDTKTKKEATSSDEAPKSQTDANSTSDNGRTTVAAVQHRTAGRRKSLDSRTAPIDSKLKAVTVDVRATWKRLQRALGVANHSFSSDEDAYRFAVATWYGASASDASTALPPWTALSDGNVSDQAAASDASSPHWLVTWLERRYLRPSLPYPLLLPHDVLQPTELELDQLMSDLKSLEKQRKLAAGANASSTFDLHVQQLHGRVTVCQNIIRQHKDHAFQLLAAAAALAPNHIRVLKDEVSRIKSVMTRNDESTNELRKQLKQQSKLHKALSAELVAWERLDKEAKSVGRRRTLSAPAETLQFALSQLAYARQGASYQSGQGGDSTIEEDVESMASLDALRRTVKDGALSIFGLTASEVKELLAIPLLVSVLSCWVAAWIANRLSRAIISISRRVRDGGVHQPSWRRVPLRSTASILRAVAFVVFLFNGTTCAVVLPVACVTWFEGLTMKKDAFPHDLGFPWSLWYRVLVLATPTQRAFVLSVIGMAIVVNAVLIGGGRQKQQPNVVPQGIKLASGRRLGSK